MHLFYFYLMRAGWMALDLLWWALADRAVRRCRLAMLWRTLIGIFACMQLAYLAYNMAEPFGPLPNVFPMPWHVLAYVWHLGIVLSTMIVWLLYRGVQALRVARR